MGLGSVRLRLLLVGTEDKALLEDMPFRTKDTVDNLACTKQWIR